MSYFKYDWKIINEIDDVDEFNDIRKLCMSLGKLKLTIKGHLEKTLFLKQGMVDSITNLVSYNTLEFIAVVKGNIYRFVFRPNGSEKNMTGCIALKKLEEECGDLLKPYAVVDNEQVKAINSGITPELVAKLQGIDLTNVVRDADYVHTDNNYTEEEKIKLSGLSNDYTQLNNLPKINGTLLTGNKTNSDLKIPMEYVDLSSDTKTLQEIGEGCYIVSKNGKINTASGYSRVIGKGTEIIIVRTNKSGSAILCATFQDGANVYRIDDDASSANDIKPFLKRSDIDTELNERSTDKKVPSSKAVYKFVKEYVNNIIK